MTLSDGAEIVGNTALLGAGGRSRVDVGIASTYRTRGSRANRPRSATAPERPARSRSTRTTLTLENAARISASTVDGTGGAIPLHAATRFASTAAPRSPRRRRALATDGDVAISGRDTIDLTRGSAISASSSRRRQGRRAPAHGDRHAGARLERAANQRARGRPAATSRSRQATRGAHGLHDRAQAGGVTADDWAATSRSIPTRALNPSDILASANAGNGGNITITAGFFVASADSTIDASSTRGLDGEIFIDSPNELTARSCLSQPPPRWSPGCSRRIAYRVSRASAARSRCGRALNARADGLPAEPAGHRDRAGQGGPRRRAQRAPRYQVVLRDAGAPLSANSPVRFPSLCLRARRRSSR